MRKDTLFRFVQKVGLETGALESFYDFSGSTDSSNRDNFYKLTSGASNTLDTYLIYNQLHSTGSQISGAVSPLININKSPAVVTSSSSSVTGSGFFEGDTTVRVTKPLNTDDYSYFLDFSGNNFTSSNTDKNQVLLSSMKDANSLSGFNLGINASNRLYLEYISGSEGSNTHRVVETLDEHLRKLNLVSLTKCSGYLEVSLHNPNYDTASIKTSIPNFTESQSVYLGGFSRGDSYSNFYTGFHGHVNSMILFTNYIDEVNRNTLSKSFYTEEIKDAKLITGALVTKKVTGAQIQSLLSGTGVVSYEQVQSGTLSTENGNVPVYVNSGVTGEIYQSYLVDLTGSDEVVNITGYYSGESQETKSSAISNLNSVPGKIAFVKPIEENEAIEIYSHNNFLSTLNFAAGEKEVDNLGESVGGFDSRGYILKNDNFSFTSSVQPHLQLYRNGMLLQEVSGLFNTKEYFDKKFSSVGTIDGDYFIDDPRENPVADVAYTVVLNDQNDGFSSRDEILYDTVSGTTLEAVYSGVNSHYTGEYYNEFLNPGKDIYLNGVKLLSGRDYSKSEVSDDGGVKLSYFLDANRLGGITGKVLFVPQAASTPEGFTRTTGTFFNTGLDQTDTVPLSNVFFEQVWRNGVRQIPGVDYLRFPNDSIATGISGASAINDSFIFDESRNNIDTKVEDVVEKDKELLFSLSNQEDLNFLK